MQQKKSGRYYLFKSLTVLVASAFLAAISIVLGKYLQIPLGNVLRFSFENTPIILAGMLFGAPVGAAVGIVADLVGCVLVGYEINPIVTLGAAVIGSLSGLVYYLMKRGKRGRVLSVTVSVTAAHLIGSVIIKTVGLSVFYAMPLHILMLWRLLNYIIVGALEVLIISLLLKNRLFMKETEDILRKK